MNKTHLWLAAALLSAGPVLSAHAQTAPPAVAPSAQAVTLRYKFAPGQTRSYQFVMDSNGAMTGGPNGMSFPLVQHMEAVMHQTVTDVRASDGAATLTVGLDNLQMTMNGNAVPMPQAQQDQMKSLGTMVMLPTGKVLSYKPNAGMTGGAMPGLDMNNLGMFQSGGTLPDQAVKPGDTWKSATSMAMMGAQVASANTLSGVDGPIAHFTTKMTGKFVPSAAGAPATALPMKIAGTLSGDSQTDFDTAEGAISSQTGTARLALTMTPKQAMPGMTGPLKMQMQIKTTLTRTTPTASAASVTHGPRGSFINDAGF